MLIKIRYRGIHRFTYYNSKIVSYPGSIMDIFVGDMVFGFCSRNVNYHRSLLKHRSDRGLKEKIFGMNNKPEILLLYPSSINPQSIKFSNIFGPSIEQKVLIRDYWSRSLIISIKEWRDFLLQKQLNNFLDFENIYTYSPVHSKFIREINRISPDTQFSKYYTELFKCACKKLNTGDHKV